MKKIQREDNHLNKNAEDDQLTEKEFVTVINKNGHLVSMTMEEALKRGLIE